VGKTGLMGAYDYEFPLRPIGAGQRGGGPAQAGGIPAAFDRASAYSALLENDLGLRLQAKKAVPVKIIVIDNVEQPTPN